MIVDIVLISATIRQIKSAETVTKIVKGHNPTTTVVLGGPSSSALSTQHRSFGKDNYVDVIIREEAEDLLSLIISRLETCQPLTDIPNLKSRRMEAS